MQQKNVRILSMILFLATLLWGVGTLIAYLGIPVHGSVLMNTNGQQSMDAACAAGDLFCRGIVGLFPFILFSIGRFAPFIAYIFASALLYALFLAWQAVRNGHMRLQFRFRPVYLLALFVASLWLMFTTLGLGSADGNPVLQVVEPTQIVYPDIGATTLSALQENFQNLQGRGCLSSIGEATNGAKIYQLKGICMQESFVTRVLTQIAFVIALLFEFLILGRFLLSLLRVRSSGLLMETVLSLGAGAAGWVAILWTLALSSHYYATEGWTLAIVMPILLFRQTLHWLRAFFFHSWEVDLSWRSAIVFLGWILLSYLALNFLTVVRPFPIGWDDLGSYLNRPRLLVSYGHFIPAMGTFQWEYLTSLGFLLFGYDSVFGATASMLVNWSAGLLAVLAVFLFARTFLGKGRGLLAAILYYTLPLVGHFSFADMKIDNAVFSVGALGMFCVFQFLPLRAEASESDATPEWSKKFLPKNWGLALLGGAFFGFAFGFKFTAIMVFLAMCVVVGGAASVSSAVGATLLVAFYLMHRGQFDPAAVRIGGDGAVSVLHAMAWVALVFAFLGIGYAAWMRRRSILPYVGGSVLLVAGFLIGIAPWIEHNSVNHGHVVPSLELGLTDTLSPVINIGPVPAMPAPGQTVKNLPADLVVNMQNPACVPTGNREELDRYWGFSTGWGHYLTLPVRTVMNVDSAGYYVTTMPALLLFPLLLLLPMFWMKRGKWLRWMFYATALIVVQWMFLANGILWYGIGMFLGLAVGLEALAVYAPDALNRWLVLGLLSLSILCNFSNRIWQFEQQRNLLEYPIGKISAEALRIRTIPYYDGIRATVVDRHTSMPDQPYVYRVGTFIPYFIPKSLEVIGLTDNQLDTFNCLNQERDPELTLKRLKALGFNSIIFDTNTATIEQDSEGSLHKKVAAFADFLNAPSLHLQVLVNDTNAGIAFILLP